MRDLYSVRAMQQDKADLLYLIDLYKKTSHEAYASTGKATANRTVLFSVNFSAIEISIQ
jgi:hypothetical protein